MTEPKDNQTAVNDTRTLARSDTKLTQPRSLDVLKNLTGVYDGANAYYRPALEPWIRLAYRRLVSSDRRL